MRLVSRPDLAFTWRTDAIEPDASFTQTCTAGPGSSAGKTLRFDVVGEDDGRVRVSLAHGEWDAADAELPFCNTYWGKALARLRDHLEQTAWGSAAMDKKPKDYVVVEPGEKHPLGWNVPPVDDLRSAIALLCPPSPRAAAS